MKDLLFVGLSVCSAAVFAMPAQQELRKAQPLVAELMAPTMDDFKAKKKTAAEVADMAVKYAGKAETEAAKFMLYRSSIPYYVRGEAYDKAADAVELMKANVKDVPASVIEEIISKATVRATAKKAPRLFELYHQAKAQSVAERDVAAFRAKLKKNPGSLPTVRNLAEALATSGNWDAALKEFAKLKDEAAQMAKAEQDGSAKSAELGEFWWGYKPTYGNADDTFEMRAAVHYRKALAAGEITGLKKNIVEQRIAKYGAAEGSTASVLTPTPTTGSIELKTGGNSPFTVKGNEATLTLPNREVIEFVRCPAGKFRMFRGQGASSDVTISRAFWMSKTPLTGKAAANAVGQDVKVKGRYCAFGSQFGSEKIISWLQNSYSSFLPKGAVLRQPSIAELQYAFCANGKSADATYNLFTKNEDVKVKIFCDYKGERKTAPNAWGFYDFSGLEYVLDRIDTVSVTSWENKESGKMRMLPEPSNMTDAFYWTDADVSTQYIVHRDVWWCSKNVGGPFHLVIGPDLVSEWKAKNAKK